MSTTSPTLRDHEVLALIAFAAGVLATCHAAVGHLIMPDFVPISPEVFSEPIHWGIWIVVSPIVAWTVTRHAIEAGKVRRGLLAAAALALLLVPMVALGVSAARYEILMWHFGPVRAERMRWNPTVAIPAAMLEALGDYVVLLGLYYVVALHRRGKQREVQAAELQRHLTAARLRALQAQLHPHFLFNTLNSTVMLTLSDASAARNMLVRLSDLLRRTLGASTRLVVPLSEEIDFLDRYLGIEQIRLGDRLRVVFDVDERVLSAQVPSLILQPLVENAVRHGLSKRAAGGTVLVRARAVHRRLEIDVEDDGPGFAATSEENIGIPNVRERLRQTYGDDFELSFLSAPSGGARVRLSSPLSIAPA